MDWICDKNKLLENELNNLYVNGDYLELNENVNEGSLTTQVVEVSKFTEITPSWNSKTNKDNSVELLIKIRIQNEWTPYISYGIWSTDGYNKGIKGYDSFELVRVTEDRIFVKDNKFGDAVQIKVIFRGKSPKLMLVRMKD